MRAIRKIAIFMPRPNPFYTSLFFYLKSAFEELGLEVCGGVGFLTDETLLEFCRRFQPDILFEMNRARREIPELPKEIRHVSWVVDTNGREVNYFTGSELQYFFFWNWRKDYNAPEAKIVDWLPPGACPHTYHNQPAESLSDFSFIGHMSAPWTEQERQRTLWKDTQHTITLGDLLPEISTKILHAANTVAGLNNEDILEIALNVLWERIGTRQEFPLETALRYDLESRVIRMVRRQSALELIQNTGATVRYYGTGHWEKWPEYKNAYHGPIFDPEQVRKVYVQSRINYHEGVTGIHFRTLDCLSSGGFMFILETPDDSGYGGTHALFTNKEHYVAVNPDNFQQMTQHYLNNESARKAIGANAAQLIREKHTWRHRAEKILSDLSRL
ncbi:MAG: glycosyltransferase family 1 protein [Magnetococcales bacterium]|nr:glycosyltransferase family 1 protein [Magnetococcales bacterium]